MEATYRAGRSGASAGRPASCRRSGNSRCRESNIYLADQVDIGYKPLIVVRISNVFPNSPIHGNTAPDANHLSAIRPSFDPIIAAGCLAEINPIAVRPADHKRGAVQLWM